MAKAAKKKKKVSKKSPEKDLEVLKDVKESLKPDKLREAVKEFLAKFDEMKKHDAALRAQPLLDAALEKVKAEL